MKGHRDPNIDRLDSKKKVVTSRTTRANQEKFPSNGA